MDSLDNAIAALDDMEAKQNTAHATHDTGREKIGTVEKFFGRISVAAISLSSDLKLNDLIEIGNEDEAIRQRVSSMQINNNDVSIALKGASVGIKVGHAVKEGTPVYRVGQSGFDIR